MRISQLKYPYSISLLKWFIVFALVIGLSWPTASVTLAKPSPVPTSERIRILEQQREQVELTATPSASVSAQTEATTSGLVKKVVEKQPDLTEPKPEVQVKLEEYLKQQSLGPLSFTNPLKHVIRLAVARGVPANMIVLILLFPLVTAWVAFSRHVIGLAGFGIFTPAILAVVFLATGVLPGLVLFLTIIFAATFSRLFLRRIKLQYLPRLALLLWFVSLTVFGLLFLASYIPLPEITVVSIFPILILILLVENFMEIQIKEGMQSAASKSLITVLVAVAGYWLLKWELLQRFILLEPEMAVLSVGLFDIILGRYSGLRWLEYYRFRQILKVSKTK